MIHQAAFWKLELEGFPSCEVRVRLPWFALSPSKSPQSLPRFASLKLWHQTLVVKSSSLSQLPCPAEHQQTCREGPSTAPHFRHGSARSWVYSQTLQHELNRLNIDQPDPFRLREFHSVPLVVKKHTHRSYKMEPVANRKWPCQHQNLHSSIASICIYVRNAANFNNQHYKTAYFVSTPN